MFRHGPNQDQDQDQASQANLQNRHVRCAVLNDEGRRGARRQDPQEGLANRSNLRDARSHFGVFMKKNFDDRNAVVTLRLYVLGGIRISCA